MIPVADSIIAELLENNCDTVYSSVKTSEADRFFNSLLISRAGKLKISFFISDLKSGKTPYLDLNTAVTTEYMNDEDNDDSLRRQIRIDFSGSLTLETGKIVPFVFEEQTFTDKISRKDAVLYNESAYDFAKAEIPEPPASFWKDIVQPVAIVSAAVITVVLLFTMRSN